MRRNGTSRKVLVVRLDAIGDFVLWLNSAKGLRELYPKEKFQLILVGNRIWSDLAADLPLFDEVWPFDRRKFTKNLLYRWSFLIKIRRQGFAVAIQPTYSPEPIAESLIKASGADHRLRFDADLSNLKPWQRRITDRWYTRLIPVPQQLCMELENNAEFVRGCGLAQFEAGLPELPVSAKVPQVLTDQEYYVVFPGAGAEIRQWPIQNFRELAERIYRTTGWTGVICGGPGEESLGYALEADADFPFQNLIGKTSLQDLISIIARAKVVICNETSAVHIAAAVSTPSVCVLGGGHYGRFMPYPSKFGTHKSRPTAVVHQMSCFGCNWRCSYCSTSEEVAPCISHIAVDDVWAVVESKISAKG